MPKPWQASDKTVRVRCPVKGCTLRGVAAANAVREDTPHKFRATCPEHDQPLREAKS